MKDSCAYKHSSGVYAKSCDGGKDMLLFHVREIDGKKYCTYEKNGKVVAFLSIDEILAEINRKVGQA